MVQFWDLVTPRGHNVDVAMDATVAIEEHRSFPVVFCLSLLGSCRRTSGGSVLHVAMTTPNWFYQQELFIWSD